MATRTQTETLNSLYTTTYYNRWSGIRDQIMPATPLFYMLTKNGRRKSQTGGRAIEIPLRRELNETVQFIAKGGSVTLSDTDPYTTALYQWRIHTGHIVRYGEDFRMNRGKAQLENKVNADIDTLVDSMREDIETKLFEDQSSDSSLAINGLKNIVADSPSTGTLAGINRASESWWRNQSTNMTGETVSVYLLKRMRAMWNDCGSWGSDNRFPDIIVCSDDVYEAYEEEASEIQRITDPKLGELGFGSLAFKGAPFTWSPKCDAYRMYMLNTKHISWITDPMADMKMGDWLPILNQPEDYIVHVKSACNLVADNCRKQGVIYNIGN